MHLTSGRPAILAFFSADARACAQKKPKLRLPVSDIRNRYTDDEFEQEVASLKVYYLSATNEKIYYGGSEDYCRKLSNWEYGYSEDDNYGMHDYILRIRNE